VRTLAATGYEARETDPGARPDKIIAETAILLMASSTACRPYLSLSAIHNRLARGLISHARSPRIWAAICMQPRAASELAFAHGCLTRLGYPDAGLDALVVAAIDAAASMGRERLPHRVLEQEWIARVTGWPWPESRETLRGSMLGLGLDALSITRDDAYGFTHAVMYASDFGTRTTKLPRPWRSIEADAEVGVAFALDQEDYDLLGELLLTWPLLHKPWSAVASFAFHTLTRVHDQAGFLPPPGLTVAAYLAVPQDQRSRFALAAAYHTTYVAGLVASAGLAPGGGPPRTVPTSRREAGAAEALMDLLAESANESEPTPHWQQAADRLDASQRSAISSLLLNVCLHRATTRRDLALISRALDVAVRYRLGDQIAARQAADLLRRASHLEFLTVST